MNIYRLIYSSATSYGNLFLNFLFATLLINLTNKTTYALFAHATAILSLAVIIFTCGQQRSLIRFEDKQGGMAAVSTLACYFWILIITLGSIIYYYIYIKGWNPVAFSLVLMVGFSLLTANILPLWQWKHQVISYNHWLLVMGIFKILVLLPIYFFPQYINELFLLNAIITTVLTTILLVKTELFKPAQLGSVLKLKQTFSKLIQHTRTIGLPFWASLIAATIYIRIDIVLLHTLRVNPANIGLYAYVESIIYAILLLPGSIATYITGPLISKSVDGYKFWQQYQLWIISMASLVSLGAYFSLPPILELLLNTHTNLQPLIAAFIPGIMFAFLATFLNLALITEYHANLTAWGNIIAAISCVALNLYLIPRYGIMGAAYATSITYIVLSSYFLIFCIQKNTWRLKERAIPLLLLTVLYPLGFYTYLVYIIGPIIFFLYLKLQHTNNRLLF